MQAFGWSVGLVGSPQAVRCPGAAFASLPFPDVRCQSLSRLWRPLRLRTSVLAALRWCRRASSDIAAGLDPGPVAQSVRAHA